MTVKFREGAIYERLKVLSSGTGILRDKTGLSEVVVFDVLEKNEAPDDVAATLEAYLGTGLRADDVINVSKAQPVSLPEDEPDVSEFTVEATMEKVESGEWDARETLDAELEGKARSTLVRRLEEYLDERL